MLSFWYGESPGVVPRPVASTSSENLLEMHILRPSPFYRVRNSGGGLQNLCVPGHSGCCLFLSLGSVCVSIHSLFLVRKEQGML